MTPCVNSAVSDLAKEYCVLVYVFLRILYHPEEEVYTYLEKGLSDANRHRKKREPLTAITIATLFGLGVARLGTRTASLVTSNRHLASLRAAVDEDTERIEASITSLEKSLVSLSEVVLQNKRGLDLLFLQQGGPCAALKEECCFYVNHSGVVRENMEKVREGLTKKKGSNKAGSNPGSIAHPG